MGMYNGLRGWIRFKEKYCDDINRLVYEDDVKWNDILLDLKGVEQREAWVSKGRSHFIPFGAVCCMPDDWNEKQPVKFVHGHLSFTCSLKNYCSEIQTFLDLLPLIATSWRLEELYEEDDEPTIHKQDEL